MPILNEILDNKVLGREFKRGRELGVQEGIEQGIEQGIERGELKFIRRLIDARFGGLPKWAEERIANRSTKEIEELGVRLLTAGSLEELLK